MGTKRTPSKTTSKTPSTKPRRLGRGLSALIDDPTPAKVEVPSTTRDHDPAPDQQPNAQQSGLAELAIALIEPNKYQPRRSFDENALAELAGSIKAQGLLQPVVVRRIDGSEPPRYELIAGERRWRAAKFAGLASIPAVIRDASDQASAELALVENVQREDLNPIDRARALARLIDEFGMTQASVGERVGLDRSSVANLVRLTELEPVIQDMIAQRLLSAGHGKALLAAPAGPAREALATEAARDAWSVRATERAARDAASGGTPKAATATAPDSARSPELADLEAKLGEHLGTNVSVQLDASKTKGRLVIRFYDLDHFDGLMGKLGYTPD